MTAGFFAYNQNTGYVQITEDYRNLALRAKGSFSIVNAFPGYTGYRDSVTVPGTVGCLAFRSDQLVTILYATTAGDSTTYTFCSAAPTAVSWWLFDDPAYGQLYTGAGIGLLVWGPGGNLAYDSRMKYMKFQGIAAASTLDLPSWSGGFPGTPAVIQGNVWYIDDPVFIGGSSQWTESLTLSAVRAAGGTIVVGSNNFSGTVQDTPPTWGGGTNEQYSYTIVDVGGM